MEINREKHVCCDEAGSDSDSCSCGTCSCDSDGSCCSYESDSYCSSCSCSPRSDTGRKGNYQQDMDQIRTFIADVATLIRQAKEIDGSTLKQVEQPTHVVDKTNDEPHETSEGESTQALKNTEQSTQQADVAENNKEESPTKQDDVTLPNIPVNKELDKEIAKFEQLINNTEMALNGYTTWLVGDTSQMSPYATTVGESPENYCYTNDNTLADPFADILSPATGGEPESSDDEMEPDMDKLHSRMVALDLHSYMQLVESVLDERVRRELL
ncbi:nitrogen assimilation transcription factor nirA, putative [Babesia ovis]|uniref:Nitrogen assimilation transcription factor nirA, putative n=1 Tax=Babesia ovis TaxID=5869 RepID=A0A9W5TAM5_BABOV|nr:nitrogen assimilation transcription factor nirA, putative [Babesia ovis]